MIYAMRNPVDMSKSYYQQYYHLQGYQGTYEEFCKLLMADRVVYAPYLSHVTEVWRMRDDDNIFIQKFDEITADFEGFAGRLAEFLEKNVSEEQMENLKKYFFESISDEIATDVTNKLWKRKNDAPTVDVSQMENSFEEWTKQSFDEFDLKLN